MTPRLDTTDLLGPTAAAKEAGVSIVTLWRWTKAGKLPTVTIDGHTFVRRQDLARLRRSPRGRPSKRP